MRGVIPAGTAAAAIGLMVVLAVPATGVAQPAGLPEQFQGSVPAGEASDRVLPLSLPEALARSLQHNLGLIESDQKLRSARAARLRALTALLPDVYGQLSTEREQLNRSTSGLDITIPGVSIPAIVGPFGVNDARVYLTQSIFNWSDITHWKPAVASERAMTHANRSDRELAILAAGAAYLTVIARQATVDSTRAQLATATALHDRAVDQNRSGVIARLDVLRARVELQKQAQRLIAAENALAVAKLALARVIGLPKGQTFDITDTVPYAPLEGLTLAQALERAVATRPDYLEAKARLEAADWQHRAAKALRYPSLSAEANYGNIGSPDFGVYHGTFAVAVRLRVPIFQGTRVQAETLEADTVVQRRRAELADIDARIDEQVRVAVLNLHSASELVTVGQSNIGLANEALQQAQDRFAAGVANNLDVIQAQDSVAEANNSYIASLFTFNLSKITLAQAIGVAEESAVSYLGVK